jgi:hypothetical protein
MIVIFKYDNQSMEVRLRSAFVGLERVLPCAALTVRLVAFLFQELGQCPADRDRADHILETLFCPTATQVRLTNRAYETWRIQAKRFD